MWFKSILCGKKTSSGGWMYYNMILTGTHFQVAQRRRRDRVDWRRRHSRVGGRPRTARRAVRPAVGGHLVIGCENGLRRRRYLIVEHGRVGRERRAHVRVTVVVVLLLLRMDHGRRRLFGGHRPGRGRHQIAVVKGSRQHVVGVRVVGAGGLVVMVSIWYAFEYAIHAGQFGHLHVRPQRLGQFLVVGRLGHVRWSHLGRVPQLASLFAARALQQVPRQLFQSVFGGKVQHGRVFLVACDNRNEMLRIRLFNITVFITYMIRKTTSSADCCGYTVSEGSYTPEFRRAPESSSMIRRNIN